MIQCNDGCSSPNSKVRLGAAAKIASEGGISLNGVDYDIHSTSTIVGQTVNVTASCGSLVIGGNFSKQDNSMDPHMRFIFVLSREELQAFTSSRIVFTSIVGNITIAGVDQNNEMSGVSEVNLNTAKGIQFVKSPSTFKELIAKAVEDVHISTNLSTTVKNLELLTKGRIRSSVGLWL